MLQKFYETNKRFSKEFQISEKISKNLVVIVLVSIVFRWFPELLDATKNVQEGLVLKSLVAAEEGSGEWLLGF